MNPPTLTRHAVLGLLTLEPMSGYDIKKFVETSVAHFWNASYGNLYPQLARLHEEGLVERHVEVRESQPDRHVYSITDAGREAFLEWLAAPAEDDTFRSPLMLKLFFARRLDPGLVVRRLEAYRQRLLGSLETLRGVEGMLDRDYADDPDLPYYRITLDRGLEVAEARLRWVERTIDTVKGLADWEMTGASSPNP